MPDSYSDSRERLLRMHEYEKKGAIAKGMEGRAQNLKQSYINSVRATQGEKAARELVREVNSKVRK